jgi:class 3 adenylate cyclase
LPNRRREIGRRLIGLDRTTACPSTPEVAGARRYTPRMAACPSCGETNPDRARFCLNCGAALSSEGMTERSHETRRRVTVLFADVAGSTTIGERLDPEALREVIQRYFDAMRVAIERHEGTVEKFIGDAVMAVFGIPQLPWRMSFGGPAGSTRPGRSSTTSPNIQSDAATGSWLAPFAVAQKSSLLPADSPLRLRAWAHPSRAARRSPARSSSHSSHSSCS